MPQIEERKGDEPAASSYDDVLSNVVLPKASQLIWNVPEFDLDQQETFQGIMISINQKFLYKNHERVTISLRDLMQRMREKIGPDGLSDVMINGMDVKYQQTPLQLKMLIYCLAKLQKSDYGLTKMHIIFQAPLDDDCYALLWSMAPYARNLQQFSIFDYSEPQRKNQ